MERFVFIVGGDMGVGEIRGKVCRNYYHHHNFTPTGKSQIPTCLYRFKAANVILI